MLAKIRAVFFFMFIGYNRTGKSVTAQQLANEWRMANPHGIIAGYDPQHRFKHLIDPNYKLYAGEDGWWYGKGEYAKSGRQSLSKLRNALVVIDDMRGLNPSHNTSKDLGRLMEFRAEYSIDIIMIVHSPGLILEGISTFVSHWYIYLTKGRKAKFEDKIENFEECQLAADLMRRYGEDFPSILEDPEQFYDESGKGNHTFPHIVIDTTTGRMKPQNVNQEWAEKTLIELSNNNEN